MNKKSLRRWIWLAVSTLILGLIIYNLRQNPEWRHFNLKRLWESLRGAQPGLLILAVVMAYLTYLIRALRWGCFMAPMKKASTWVLFVGQVLGFSSIYLVGRPGEFVRPAYIAKKENVPITSMAAVWLLERIFDSICLVFLFSFALYMAPAEMSSAGHHVLAVMHHAGDVMMALTVLLVLGLLAYRLKTREITAWILRRTQIFPERAQRHIEHFLNAFAEGLQVVRSMPNFFASVVLSAILWCVNGTIFWLVMKSLGSSDLRQMSWLASALVMFCASLGLVVQFPGIGGGYQVGAILALTEMFGIEADVATGAAILIWILMSFPVILMGLGLLIHEGLSIKRLKAITEEEEIEERAATVKES